MTINKHILAHGDLINTPYHSIHTLFTFFPMTFFTRAALLMRGPICSRNWQSAL